MTVPDRLTAIRARLKAAAPYKLTRWRDDTKYLLALLDEAVKLYVEADYDLAAKYGGLAIRQSKLISNFTVTYPCPPTRRPNERKPYPKREL